MFPSWMTAWGLGLSRGANPGYRTKREPTSAMDSTKVRLRPYTRHGSRAVLTLRTAAHSGGTGLR